MSGLPFPAVVGQEEAKLALLLGAVEPRIGGVLLRGEKGSAKSTLARGLAALLPGDAPFVDLPLGAGEDRVLGSIDLAALLADGDHRFRAGLLAAAHGGVLYVDEINLLPDHLVDSLLDVATSGVNVVERDGVSHRHDARFVLIGSMNPEEGELRPQLLDRFGLAVDVVAPTDVGQRTAAVRRRLDRDAAPDGSPDPWADEVSALRAQVEATHPAALSDEVLEVASGVAVAVGAEGLRADLVLCRAAAALAGWEGRSQATADDVRRVAPLVLAHRRRRSPFDEPGIDEQELDQAFAEAGAPPPQPPAPDGDADGSKQSTGEPPPQDELPPPVAAEAPSLPTVRREGPSTAGGRAPALGRAGRTVRSTTWSEGEAVAPVATALAVAERRVATPDVGLDPQDLRAEVRERKAGNLVVLAVDTSGSMGAEQRIALARGVVLALLAEAYQRRDRVALVAVGGDEARLVLRPTASVEVARARLGTLAVGGGTPLADGLRTVADAVAPALAGADFAPVLVLITDGRATVGAGGDPVDDARTQARSLARLGLRAVVVDAEQGIPRLGLARTLAGDLGAELVDLDGLRAADVAAAVRRQVEA